MNDAPEFDAIIVGSGAGGAAAAYRLALAGHSVLVLEKGLPLPTDGSTLDFRRVVTEGAFLSREDWLDGHGRPLRPEEHFNPGGKTAWYGAAVLRFGEHEFAPEPAFACQGWPFARTALDAEYAEAEYLLGVRTFPVEPDLAGISTRLSHQSAWNSIPLGLALSGAIGADRHEASHFDGFASVAGLKADANSTFLRRIAALPNVRIETGTEVVGLLGSAGPDPRVTGVRLADGRELRAEATVLAAGALHSPRLLRRFVDRHALDGRLPCAALIGRHLKLHMLTALVALSPGRKRDLLRKTLLFTHTDFPHSSAQPLGFDGELIGTLIPALVPRSIARAVGERAYGFFLQTEDGSHPGNCVREEDRSSGPVPVMDYDERRLPDSMAEHRSFVRAFQRSLLRAGMLAFSRRIGLSGTAHACGTLAAGTDPHRSVVDADGRVHGLDGLRVADGSILPRSSRVNPSLTIYAWGLRVGGSVSSHLRGLRKENRAQPESVA